MRAVVALLVAALPMAVPACDGPPPQAAACRTTNQQVDASGAQPAARIRCRSTRP